MKFTNTYRLKEEVGAKRWPLEKHIHNQVNAHVYWEVDDYFYYLKPHLFETTFLEIQTKIEQEVDK